MNLKEHIHKMIKHHPEKICEIIEEIAKDHNEIVEMFMCHIDTLEMYNKYVKHFSNFDGTKGGHWAIEQIKNLFAIDFSTKEYTCFDFAYVVNMKYSDDGDLMSPDNLFISAQRYLEDPDYYGNPSERAYHDGKARCKYFTNGDH